MEAMKENEVLTEETVKETATQEEVTEAVEEVIEKPYTLRNLKDGDLWPLLKILKRIGVKDFKTAFIQVATGQKTVKQLGILATLDIADILIGNLGKAEEDIYALWSDISGIPVEKMKEMEFGTLPLMIYDTFSGVKNTAFFKVLSKLL